MRQLRVLVACECSGRVRDAFAARGWEAWSADLLPSEIPPEKLWNKEGDWWALGGRGFHYRGDVRDLFDWQHPLNASRLYDRLSNGFLPLWDLIIAHPPCEHLSYAGARWFKIKQADGRQAAAARFFMEIINAPSPLVAVENPHSIMQKQHYAGRATQIVQPWHFGDPYIKAIHLWLKGLPPLWHDKIVEPYGRVCTGGGSWRTDRTAVRIAMSQYEDSEGRINRAKVRSRTMPGLARAMADQWGAFAEEFYGGLRTDG